MTPGMSSELRAIEEASKAIAGLTTEAQLRVLKYLAICVADLKKQKEASMPDQDELIFDPEVTQPLTVSDRLLVLFKEKAGINSMANKVLVTAAFIQIDHKGRPVFAADIRNALKVAGEIPEGKFNLSAHLNSIQSRKGRSHLRVKAQKSKPKQYTVTKLGLKLVEELTGEILVPE